MYERAGTHTSLNNERHEGRSHRAAFSPPMWIVDSFLKKKKKLLATFFSPQWHRFDRRFPSSSNEVSTRQAQLVGSKFILNFWEEKIERVENYFSRL